MRAKSIAKNAVSRIFAKDIKSLRIDQLDGIELVSFDIFDTLIHRSCGEPSGVFRIVEQIYSEEKKRPNFSFYKERIDAEHEARRKVGPNTEVSLDDIYFELPYGSQDREVLMDLEIACEIAVCEPNRDVVKVYDNIRRNYTVVLASDMYLPRWAVVEILSNCGIEGYESLYLSCDYRQMKRNGALFKRMINDYSVSPERVLHIGDHPLADWHAPKQLGINTYFVCRALQSSSVDSSMAKVKNDGRKISVAIFCESWIIGGIESFLMNEIRHLPSGEFDITLFSTWGDSKTFANELDLLAVNRYIVFDGSKPNLFTRSLNGLREFNKVIGKKSYDVVHINTQNGLGLAYSWLAQERGVRVRIVHSHSSWFGEGSQIPKIVLHSLCQLLFGRTPTRRLAVSDEAGNHLFGKRPYEIILNGIDTERFTFSEDVRCKTRKELGLSDDVFVAGSIGRVSPEKDPIFQLNVVRALFELNPNIKYIMVGSGSLDDAVEESIEKLGLDDVVIRIGATDTPERYYFAMDAFLFPSVFEGMPIAGIEAQCAGLPVVAAQHLPRQLEITDLVIWKDKSADYTDWAKTLLSAKAVKAREYYAMDIQAGGYDATGMAEKIASIYRDDKPGSPKGIADFNLNSVTLTSVQ